MWKKLRNLTLKARIALSVTVSAAVIVPSAVYANYYFTNHSGASNQANWETVDASWPACFHFEEYEEPEFQDSDSRKNIAFNVADFGEQGSNGWFYRYGKAEKPYKSEQIEKTDGERYYQVGVDGLEVKKDFIQPGGKEAAILEWRAAEKGAVDLMVTYVKNVNADKNPSYPDGVTLTIFKGEELLETHKVDVKIDKEVLMETKIEAMDIEEDESIYVVVDANANNAYDGGLLYVAVQDVNAPKPSAMKDSERKDNNADFVNDFGAQGSNGWTYMYGKETSSCELVSTETDSGYRNVTSPSLEISQGFIHPAINDKAIIGWESKNDGEIEIRGSYTKFEQHDGNPDWPDGVNVAIYLNDKKLLEQDVEALTKGDNTISFREKGLKITTKDKLYFVVDAKGNASYDGGAFEIAILDRSNLSNEDSVTVDESETRQNFANVKDDFGEQGKNGWFFQEGYQDEPFGAYNMSGYVEDDKYVDDSFLEIKRDFVNPGKGQKSAVIKWKVAQDGDIAIDASYTKLKNEDKNPTFPDGTRVSLYHNETLLAKQEFAPEVSKEVTKDLNVESLSVKKGDYITMVINGKENNAYDGGAYSFRIRGLSSLVGASEKDVTIENDANRSNNASVATDFGKQGKNGWFYQYGYYTNPAFAVNVENYIENDKYVTKDGIEIKKDFIMPSTKDKSANVKWVVAQDGPVNVYLTYTKLKNEDKNPSWPDGTVVTLFHNGTVLKSESFAPDTENEVSKDLSVRDLNVKKGDTITMVVNGKENTAYDGGLYAFSIEDANRVEVTKKNESGKNQANLASDFGEQGSNGWYYLDGKTIDTAEVLTHKTADEQGYISVKDTGLELKKDFVQPGVNRHAMYQWITAADGEITILGNYTKFSHQDGNPSWPDGTKVRVYKNKELLFEKDAEVLEGEGNNTSLEISFEKMEVKKGDAITFDIDAKNNNAWDGGKLAVQIRPYVEQKEEYISAEKNKASLFKDFGEQGSNGWYYGCGNTSAEFKPADFNNGEYSSVTCDNLLLKKDGVHPSANAGAIYRWIVGEDGQINLDGAFYKSRNESKEDNTPDGVQVAVYLNGELVEGMSYDIPVSKDEEVSKKIQKENLEVKKGDKLDFIITAKKNAAWDYGKLEMKIVDSSEKAEEVEIKADEDNTADLFADFGKQGNKGWYYGTCEWNGANFTLLEYDAENNRYFDNGKPELKKDFVEPGNGLNAAYMWIAGEDGRIQISGDYTKYPNFEDPYATGVCIRIFQNGVEKQWIGNGINVSNIKTNVNITFAETLDVKKGDKIIFAVNPEGNDSYDGGKLQIQIAPKGEENQTRTPVANLKEDFGEQGSNGWYYGTCEWDSKNFTLLAYDAESKRYFNNGKPELKADFVEPGAGLNAAYKWKSSVDGTIDIEGEYTKFAATPDSGANGVCIRIFKNGEEEKWIGEGINQKVTNEITIPVTHQLEVARGDEIIFAINPEGNDEYDGGRLQVKIYTQP